MLAPLCPGEQAHGCHSTCFPQCGSLCARAQLDNRRGGGEPADAPAPLELRFPDSRGHVARHAWLSGGRLLVGFSSGEPVCAVDEH